MVITMEEYIVIGLGAVWVKDLLGYAYFDFYQFFKRGKDYARSHSEWMDKKP